MPASQGELQADTFALPTTPQLNPQAGPSGNVPDFEHLPPFDDGVKPETGLQYVHGQTSEYYRKVENLKRFMQHAHTNYGIDVRVPDLKYGEVGMKLNQIYSSAMADILAQGNELKNSHGTMAMLVNNRAQFLKDPAANYADRARPEQDYTYNQIDPLVVQTNTAMNKAYYDKSDYDIAMQKHKEVLDHFEQLKKDHPELTEHYDRQIAALESPRKFVFKPTAQNEQERMHGRKVEAAGHLATDLIFLGNGVDSSYQYNPNTDTLESSKFAGSPIGKNDVTGKPITIEKWVMNPDTKEVTVVLSDGTRVNGKSSIGALMKQMADAGSGATGVTSYHIDEALAKRDWHDRFQNVNSEKVMSETAGTNPKTNIPYWKEHQQEILDKAVEGRDQLRKPAEDAMDAKIKGMEEPDKGGWFGFGAKPGGIIQFGKYEVERLPDGKYTLTGPALKRLSEEAPITHKTTRQKREWARINGTFNDEKELKAFLRSHGIPQQEYLDALHKGTAQPPNPTSTPAAIDNDPAGILHP